MCLVEFGFLDRFFPLLQHLGFFQMSIHCLKYDCHSLSKFKNWICMRIYIYIYSDTYDVANGLQNTAYWILMNKSLNETVR